MVFSPDGAAWYLAAMIDGEGNVTRPGPGRSRAVRITNTDRGLIAACERCCTILGIEYAVYARSKKRCRKKQGYDLAIYGRDNFETLLSAVPIQAISKKARLEGIVASYKPRPANKQLLNDLYVVQSLSQSEMAERLNVHRSTIGRWLAREKVSRVKE